MAILNTVSPTLTGTPSKRSKTFKNKSILCRSSAAYSHRISIVKTLKKILIDISLPQLEKRWNIFLS